MIQWKEIPRTEVNLLKDFATQFKIHELVLEDCIHQNQRPKLEDYESHQFLVWFMLVQDKIYELQFVLFADQVLMVPHEAPPQGKTWNDFFHLGSRSADAINYNFKDVWHLLYFVLDRATDETWNSLRRLSLDLDEIERQLFVKNFQPRSLLRLKKKINQVDYSLGHLASVAKQIQNFSEPKDDLRLKLRDLFDHCERIDRSVVHYRNQIGSTLDLYWGLEANRTNKQVKRLSLLASISVPLTFWASFWGMNFQSIPFESSKLFIAGILIMLGSVALTAFLLIKRGYWRD